MNNRKKIILSDGLEFVIIFSLIFMLISIYVPKAIWAEEESYQNESRFRMENIYDVEDFYHQLMDEFSSNPFQALNVVNAIRDSLTADSTFLNEQILYLEDQEFSVNIPKGFDVGYDTTFGFRKNRKDSVTYTQYVVVNYSQVRDAYDTTYVVEADLEAAKEDPNFDSIIAENQAGRVEIITYYDSYMPDSSYFFCPLTNEPYEVSVDGGLKVTSPIKEVITERKYLLFSFRAPNHGYIEDGVRSWKM